MAARGTARSADCVEANPTSGPLRPLTLGELLDRAVTLCVRFFVPLALVEAVSAVAQCAYAIYAGADVGSFWTRLAGEIGGHPVVAAPVPGGANGLGLLLILVVQPFVGGALIAMTCSLYLGLPTSFRQAYRTAAQRGDARPHRVLRRSRSGRRHVRFGIRVARRYRAAGGARRSGAARRCVRARYGRSGRGLQSFVDNLRTGRGDCLPSYRARRSTFVRECARASDADLRGCESRDSGGLRTRRERGRARAALFARGIARKRVRDGRLRCRGIARKRVLLRILFRPSRARRRLRPTARRLGVAAPWPTPRVR